MHHDEASQHDSGHATLNHRLLDAHEDEGNHHSSHDEDSVPPNPVHLVPLVQEIQRTLFEPVAPPLQTREEKDKCGKAQHDDNKVYHRNKHHDPMVPHPALDRRCHAQVRSTVGKRLARQSAERLLADLMVPDDEDGDDACRHVLQHPLKEGPPGGELVEAIDKGNLGGIVDKVIESKDEGKDELDVEEHVCVERSWARGNKVDLEIH
mmetsp:Transcript_37633/g.88042  ORF Transcript_37633/g.88042 Transcript_37633/m.88042 type:complete len:208 (+) Transcript_37633:1913-2536(+)